MTPKLVLTWQGLVIEPSDKWLEESQDLINDMTLEVYPSVSGQAAVDWYKEHKDD